MIKSCFIISSIGKENSQIRKVADEKYDLIFEPILKELDYDVTRSDKIASPGSISREIVQKLIDSNLVIADVTDENPNVFYELAIRNAIKKSVIIFKRHDQTMPFDVYDKRAISIERTDPRLWEDAKTKLRAQIKMAENNPEQASESIISDFTFNIKKSETISDSDRIFSMLKDLKQEVRKLSGEKELTHTDAVREYLKRVMESVKVTGAHHISIPAGTSVPGCEEKNECFIPCELKIKKGETVEWTNDDSAAHTVTSGTSAEGPDGLFDSGLFMSGEKFHFTFIDYDSGEYTYFCMVHTWQQGKIIIK